MILTAVPKKCTILICYSDLFNLIIISLLLLFNLSFVLNHTSLLWINKESTSSTLDQTWELSLTPFFIYFCLFKGKLFVSRFIKFLFEKIFSKCWQSFSLLYPHLWLLLCRNGFHKLCRKNNQKFASHGFLKLQKTRSLIYGALYPLSIFQTFVNSLLNFNDLLKLR